MKNVSNVMTMTSLEIARLTGKAHDKVNLDIEKMLEELEIGIAGFRDSYLSSQNKRLKMYSLPRKECDCLLTGYSAKLRMKVIARWHELESQQKPLSIPEQIHAISGWMIEQEKVNAQIPILTDKVAELADKVSHTDDLFHLGDRTSIKAYCNTRQIKLSTKQAAIIGRACAKLCSKEGVEMTKLPCPYFGEVNGYPVWVVEEILAGWGYLD